MQKKYSLNYTIQRDVDRVKAVKDILDSMDTDPSPTDLEQLGSYILYGKDEEGYNAVQRGEITDGNKRYNSYKRKDDTTVSLNALLDNPLTNQEELKPAHQRSAYTAPLPLTPKRPKYGRDGHLIDIGDGDIPGMQELWSWIDHLEHIVAENEGKIPVDNPTHIVRDEYRLYQLKHWLIDLRRHPYYLRDAYKPQIHFLAVDHPKAAFYEWDSNAEYWVTKEELQRRLALPRYALLEQDINKYETDGNGNYKWVVRKHNFDWENPAHIRALINCYDDLYHQMREKLDTYARTLIFDFERYLEMIEYPPIKLDILYAKIHKMPYKDITHFIFSKYGVLYNENHLCLIFSNDFPQKIAETAAKWRLICETPQEEKKICSQCGRALPRSPLFFIRNKNRPDGLMPACKDCDRRHRIEKGAQTKYDRRVKEAKMLKMQNGKAGAVFCENPL